MTVFWIMSPCHANATTALTRWMRVGSCMLVLGFSGILQPAHADAAVDCENAVWQQDVNS
jgi:hypothetical protein